MGYTDDRLSTAQARQVERNYTLAVPGLERLTRLSGSLLPKAKPVMMRRGHSGEKTAAPSRRRLAAPQTFLILAFGFWPTFDAASEARAEDEPRIGTILFDEKTAELSSSVRFEDKMAALTGNELRSNDKGAALIGTIRLDDRTALPIYFEPPVTAPDGTPRLFLWPSEEEVDEATRLLIGQPREQYDEDLRVMSEVMLGQRDEQKRYSSTLKEMVLAPLALKAMLEPDVDFLGIPASCHGKASFSGAYAGCSLRW